MQDVIISDLVGDRLPSLYDQNVIYPSFSSTPSFMRSSLKLNGWCWWDVHFFISRFYIQGKFRKYVNRNSIKTSLAPLIIIAIQIILTFVYHCGL